DPGRAHPSSLSSPRRAAAARSYCSPRTSCCAWTVWRLRSALTLARSAWYTARRPGDRSMIKADIVNRVADSCDIPRIKAAEAVDTILDAIKDALTDGKR